jgi:hypothetical protein
MTDAELRELEARWRAEPRDARAGQAALTAFRASRVDAPLDLLLGSAEWLPFVEFAHAWFRAPLGPELRYTSAELDAIERRKGVRFPPTAREWWRIAGKHPCCGAWEGGTGGARFFRPDERIIARGGLLIAELDEQTGISFIIHHSLLDQPDPEVFEHNPIADEKDYCVDRCLRTHGTIPSIIWQSVVSMA